MFSVLLACVLSLPNRFALFAELGPLRSPCLSVSCRAFRQPRQNYILFSFLSIAPDSAWTWVIRNPPIPAVHNPENCASRSPRATMVVAFIQDSCVVDVLAMNDAAALVKLSYQLMTMTNTEGRLETWCLRFARCRDAPRQTNRLQVRWLDWCLDNSHAR